MKVNDESEYRFTLEFPLAKTYAVDDILNKISEVVYDRSHSYPIERIPFRSGKWNNDIDECHQVPDERPMNALTTSQVTNTELENCENPNEGIELPVSIQRARELDKKKTIDDYKTYLIDRLLKAVAEGKFELRDWTGDKVVDPPINNANSSSQVLEAQRKPLDFNTILPILSGTSSPARNSPPEPNFMPVFAGPAIIPNTFLPNHRPVYQTAYWWGRMTTISKPDLIKFCSGEGIHAIFEDNPSTVQVPPQNPAKPNNAINTVTMHSTADAVPPGIMPKRGIGKLAVQAAWELENKIGRRTTPQEVILELRKWAAEGRDGSLKGPVDEAEFFKSKNIKPTELLVVWTTNRGEGRPWGVPACDKALKTWNSSRD